jgi:hypothetical protein
MSSRRSPKVYVTQGLRTSSSSLSSRSDSSKSSASSSYTSSNYDYNSESSAAGNMGRSDYEQSSSRPRDSFLRVTDPSRKACTLNICSPHANSMSIIASKDGITKTSRGNVDVIIHEKIREDPNEPRSSYAESSEYHKTSPNRKPKP